MIIVGLAQAAETAPATTALPTNGQVVAGSVHISTDNSNANAPVMNVNQASQRAVVNWDKFDVGSAATVNFNQPNAQASTLNRISDANPSKVFGKINAPGEVVLVNQAGVYFAPSANVDVGSVVATTHSISDADYMAGKAQYDRNGATGKVVNEGNIKTGLAGYVALLAPEVRNSGVVVAQMGTVVMAAGERITLNFDPSRRLSSITTTPSAIETLIENKNAVRAPGGIIILSARAVNSLTGGVIKQSGTLSASADSNTLIKKGGRIMLSAGTVTLSAGSKTVARGETGGGTVEVVASKTATVEAGAKVSVSATGNGNAGSISIHSEEKTTINGTLLAQGGKVAGNGGSISTTSNGQLEIGATAEVKAGVRGESGQVGTWNVTATNVEINQSNAPVIAATLNQANVNVKAQAGNVVVKEEAVIQKTAPVLTTLKMQASNSVVVRGKMLSSALSPIVLQIISENAVELASSAAIQANQVLVQAPIISASGDYFAYFWQNGAGSLPLISFMAGRITLAGSLRSGSNGRAGKITVLGLDGVDLQNANLNASGDDGGEVSIISRLGSVNLTNSLIQANGASGLGGTISVAANNTLVSNGQLTVSSQSATAGLITLEAQHILLNSQANLSATGATGGGSILVGGDWQGSGTLRQASTVTMHQGARIDVSATLNGNGGKVVLWSDIHNTKSVTRVHGAIFANAGLLSGNGGQIETSGRQLDIIGVTGSASSIHGLAGEWLFDPGNITIASGSGTNSNCTFSAGACEASGTSTVYEANIEALLNAGTSVTLSTGTGANYDITVNAEINKTAGGNATLTLKASNQVIQNFNIISTVGKLNVILWAESDWGTTVGVESGGITTMGGHVWIGGGGGSAVWYGLTVGDGVSHALGLNANGVELGGNITTNGGSIYIAAGDGYRLNNGSIVAFGGNRTLNAGTGNITLMTEDHRFIDRSAPYQLTLVTTGILTIAPPNAIDNWVAGFIWSGKTVAFNEYLYCTEIINGQAVDNGLVIDRYAYYLGGLSLGTYAGTGVVGDTPYTPVNYRDVSVQVDVIVTGPITLYSRATNGGGISFINNLTTSDTNLGNITITGTGVNGNGNVAIASGRNLTVTSTLYSSFSGIVSGAASVTKAGLGELILTGKSTYTGITTISAGTLTFRNNAPSLTSSSFVGPGNLVIQPATSFSNPYTFDETLSSLTKLGGLTIGKSGNTANITSSVAVNVNGPVAIYGGNIAINAALTAASSNLSLFASVAVTQTAAVTAGSLVLGGAGSVTLTNASNSIRSIASATSIGALSLINTGDLTIGSITLGASTYSGLNSTGIISVKTTGNLTISQNVATSSSAATASKPALLLAAGSTSSIGNSTYNIILSGSPSLTVGAGGIADFYSGAVNASTGLSSYVDRQSTKTYTYAADITTLPSASGYNVIYRGNQAIYLTIVDSQTNTYGSDYALYFWYSISPTSYGVSYVPSSLSAFNTVQTYTAGQTSMVINSNGLSGTVAISTALTPTLAASTYALTLTPSLVLSGSSTAFSGGDAKNFTVNPKALNFTVAKVYDGNATFTKNNAYSLTGMVNNEAEPTISAGSASIASANANATSPATAFSSNTLVLSNANYTLTGGAVSASIHTRPIIVNPTSGLSKVYGEADGTLSYTLEAVSSGRGLVVGDNFSGALARAVGEGVSSAYAINQGTLANSNYAITIASANFAITPRPIYVTANSGQTKVYGETDPTFTYTTAANTTGSGLMGTDGVTLGGALARATGSDVATNYAINQGTLAISSGSNYSIQYTGANFAITARPITVTPTSSQAKVYGEVDSTLTYAFEASSAGRGLVVGDSFSGVLARAVGEDVNSYSINQGTLANSNYAVTMASVNFAITARPIYIAANAGQTKVYGETDPTFAYTTAAKTTGSGLMGTDGVTLTGALARASGADVATNYAINQGTLAISSGSNYSIQYTGADFAITARPIFITANSGQTKVYGETDGTFTYTTAAKTTGSGLMGTDGVTLSGALARATGADVATNYTINQGTLAISSGSNYSIQYTGANFAITAKPVVISSNNSTNTYDGVSTYEDFANAAGFSTNVPLIGSDAIGSFTQAVTVGGLAATGVAQAGNFVATPSAAIMASGSASNYAFTYSATTNTVAKANLSIAATASLSGNVYNGSAYTGTYTSTFLGSDASLAVISGLATGSNVGSYASNIAVSGAVLDNYNAPTISDASLVISPRPISITPTVATKVEGDDDPVMEVSISAGSLALGDHLSDVMATISRTAGEEVASYDILMSMGIKAANYDISYDTSNAAFSITDRPVVSTGSVVAGAILVNEDEEGTRRDGRARRDRRRSSSGRCFP